MAVYCFAQFIQSAKREEAKRALEEVRGGRSTASNLRKRWKPMKRSSKQRSAKGR